MFLGKFRMGGAFADLASIDRRPNAPQSAHFRRLCKRVNEDRRKARRVFSQVLQGGLNVGIEGVGRLIYHRIVSTPLYALATVALPGQGRSVPILSGLKREGR